MTNKDTAAEDTGAVEGQAPAGLDVRIAQELIDRARELSSEGQLKLVGHRSLVEV